MKQTTWDNLPHLLNALSEGNHLSGFPVKVAHESRDTQYASSWNWPLRAFPYDDVSAYDYAAVGYDGTCVWDTTTGETIAYVSPFFPDDEER